MAIRHTGNRLLQSGRQIVNFCQDLTRKIKTLIEKSRKIVNFCRKMVYKKSLLFTDPTVPGKLYKIKNWKCV